ncbi:MAG TPA: ion channel [Steroidobacteraceae bacterium]|nr:ion channel [Steroidobacteraceae bacterium]
MLSPSSGRNRTVAGRPFISFGLPYRPWQDLYHFFMTVSWPRFFASLAAFFVFFNLFFSAIYSLQPRGIANLNPPGYPGLFFFSVETLATVGYGDMHPHSLFAHAVASVEIFTGMMCLALMTGMIFARFSRPTARFLFARHTVVRPFDGMPTLMLRVANARQNILMEATAQLRLIRDEKTLEGDPFRRIYDLPLRRHEQPVLLFGWLLMHVMDESSPLFGATPQSLTDEHAYLLLTVSGIDEVTGQRLMARHAYAARELRWNHAFVDTLQTDADGVDHFDYTKFHDVRPLNLPELVFSSRGQELLPRT